MRSANWTYLVIGLITAALGAMPFLAYFHVLPTRAPRPDDAPAWVAFAIGLAFVLAGIMVIVRGFAGADDGSSELPQTASRGLRAFYTVLVTPIPILLAVLLSWVAFGPGERHFTMIIGSGGTAAAMRGNETVGRVLFGVCAVLCWVVVISMLRSLARRWLSGQQAQQQ